MESDRLSAAWGKVPLMVHIRELLAQDLALTGPRPVSLGFTHVDRLTGGLSPGRLLLVATPPGQGKTTYATQCAGAGAGAAAAAGRSVQLHCPRETPRACAARLVASLARVAYDQLLDARPLEGPANQRAEQVRAHLTASHLDVNAGTDLNLDDRPAVEVLIVDDAHLGPPDTPARLRQIADSGVIVIATIPDDLLLRDAGAGSQQRLHRPWADACDLAISLTWPNEIGRAGEVDLSLLKNRHGPLMDEVIAFQGHYSRFCDVKQP